jgi:hypothetical protein
LDTPLYPMVLFDRNVFFVLLILLNLNQEWCGH